MPTQPRPGPIISGTMAHWQSTLKDAQKRTFPTSYTIHHPGDSYDKLYYIVAGEVLISNYSPVGDINKLFIARANSILGLIGMFGDAKAMVSWITLTPCQCYIFERKYIFEEAPRELFIDMIQQMASMANSVSRRFSKSHMKRLEVRLARLLMHLTDACERFGNSPKGTIIIKPNMTQKMASGLLDMHYVTLNRILAAFKEQGIISNFTKKRMEIRDPKTLQRYANGEMPPLKY